MKDPYHLRQRLERQDKETLIALIERLLAMDPSKWELVRALVEPAAVESFEPAPMRARADRVFTGKEPDGRPSRRIEAALERLLAEAKSLEDGGHIRAAASAYAGLLLSIAHHVEWQAECEYDGYLEDCSAALQRCMDEEEDDDVSAQMLAIFGEVLAFDILSGGYSLDNLVGPVLLERASLPQRRDLVRRLSDRFRDQQRREKSSLSYELAALRAWGEKLLPEEDPATWLPRRSGSRRGIS